MPSPLATVFSAIESAKRRVGDTLSNPIDAILNTIPNTAQKHREHQARMEQAFGNVQRPFEITDRGAFNEVVDSAFNNLQAFAPAGIFVGPRAKGIDNIALAMAMKDQRKGRPAAEIWQEHNWAKGPDGFWRSEIDDSQAMLQLVEPNPTGNVMYGAGGSSGPLAQTLEHPEFKKAYPGIWEKSTADVIVRPGPTSGSFSRFAGSEGGNIRAYGPNDLDVMDTVLHELQHAVQKKEGFAGGGNPTMFKTSDPQEAFRLYQRLGGEAESRLTEMRSADPIPYRRSHFPFDPEYFRSQTGVPLSDLIMIPAP